MIVLNLPDLAKKIGRDYDGPFENWSRTLQRALMTGVKDGTPLVPNGTVERDTNGDLHVEPTIVRIPEVYHAVSSIEPYRDARHIQLGDDPETGFHFSTFGVGHDGEVERDIERATRDAAFCIELDNRYRGRFLLGGVGGHGWRATMKLVGPKLPGMPWRSPSGVTATDRSQNCLEAQHAFWPKDFGRDRTPAEVEAGVPGWALDRCDFGHVWGDAISPGTVKPNDRPAEGLTATASHFHDLGRVGLLISNLRGFEVTGCTFGNLPSSIVHAETGGGTRIIGHGRLEGCTIQSGKRTVSVTGEKAELEDLEIVGNVRRDRQHSIYIDAGPKLTTGPRAGQMRARRITVAGNTHERFVDGERLGYYQLCSDVAHIWNAGPVSKRFVKTGGTLDLRGTLYHHGSTRIVLAPNSYTAP